MPANQTRDEWLFLPSVMDDPQALGTGIYLATWDNEREYQESVQYEPFVETAYSKNYAAFCWVPHVVSSYQRVKSQNCKHLRCAGKCPPGCICDETRGRCK